MTTPLQTPGDAREDHAQASGDAIAAVFAQAELVTIAAIASLARKLAAGQMTQAVAVRQLRRTVNAVLGADAPKVRKVLDDAMQDASRQASAAIASAAGTPGGLEHAEPLAVLLDHAADTAARSAEDDLAAVTTAIRGAPPPENPYQAALSGAFDRNGGWPGSTLSYRRIQAAQDMLDDLAAKGVTGFTDKAGRNWDLATYAEMATRTAVSNAWDDMQHSAMLRAGFDLAVIGTHSTEGSCPHCLPWLGRTISLSGATAGYPTYDEARAAGWRHPNCRCFDTPLGAGIAPEVTNPVAIEQAAAAYKASQHQRALERKVREAGRRYHAAVTPQARAKARRDLAAARANSAAHRQKHGVRMMKVSVQRRERPFGAR